MEVKPMTDEEAREEIRKRGGYETVRQSSYANVSEDTGQELPHIIEYELTKNYNGDATKLFQEKPHLYPLYRESMWIKVGTKVKD